MKTVIKKNCITCTAEFETTAPQKRFCDPCKKAKQSTYAIRHPKQRMVTGARYRAAEEKVPFDLVESDFDIPDTCPVLGIPLQSAVGKGCFTDNSPSLDKVIPALGYVKGNVVIMSARANRMKSNASVDDVERLYKWMKAGNYATSTTPSVPLIPPKSGPKKSFVKSEETRRKLSQSQAIRWAGKRTGKIQQIVDSVIQQTKDGRTAFIATSRTVGYVTRLKQAGLDVRETDGGLVVSSPSLLTTHPPLGIIYRIIATEDAII